MNALVLAIAGVLVVVGIALIAFSIVLARKQTPPEEPTADTPEAEPPDSPDLAFIDQPLKTDMAIALGHTESPGADDDPTEETEVVELQTQDDIEDDIGGSTRPDKED
jgi:hypothetical protein